MTGIIDTRSKRHLSAKLAGGLAIAALLAVGTFAASANAEGWEHHGNRHHWNNGYYAAPPVVYGSPYGYSYYGQPYYPPPVVYAPGIGIGLPGINVNIR